ncbi:MAG: DUF808 domain-containing protein [Devosiaceae bacterium]|nr:DUF808 domain-containing protein [Devosiaceae bacterium]
MSGLIALFDDIAAIAKVAAASVDDIVTQAAKAGAKAAGAVIDDAAVTPRYVQGFHPDRELPIVWRIAKGSIKNKLLILLPAGLLLSAFAPWAIMPLLMLGGAYLCFEGAEKVAHLFMPHDTSEKITQTKPGKPKELEEEKIAGAIKTDFILSAEIMAIALASIPKGSIWMEAATLAVVAIGITIMVYGSVAIIVKADDVGLHMASEGRFSITRAVGRAVVKGMPGFLKALVIVGTAAMLWVGGSIFIHGLSALGFGGLEYQIKDWAIMVSGFVPDAFQAIVDWFAKATMDGIFGLALGLAIIPMVKFAGGISKKTKIKFGIPK